MTGVTGLGSWTSPLQHSPQSSSGPGSSDPRLGIVSPANSSVPLLGRSRGESRSRDLSEQNPARAGPI